MDADTLVGGIPVVWQEGGYQFPGGKGADKGLCGTRRFNDLWTGM